MRVLFQVNSGSILLLASLFLQLTSGVWSELKEPENKIEDRLEIYGNKEIIFSDYRYSGDFNQFVQKNPQVITDSKFDQHTRIHVRGSLGKGVNVNAVFDDSNQREEDEKILLQLKSDAFEAALGRISIDLEGTRFVLNNKKALGFYFSKKLGRWKSSWLLSRSEGKEERQQFFGQGLQREYILKKSPVVPGSEKLYLDERLLRSGSDYRMDYEGGSLHLDHKLLPVESTSNLIVEYESTRDGSAYKNRVFATRNVYALPGENRDIGLTFAMEKDQVSEAALNSFNTPPHKLSIFALDSHWKFSDALDMNLEWAHSVDDQDIVSTSLPDLRGNALDLGVNFKKGGHKLRLRNERIEPKFRSIGKNQFLSQGEDSNLVGDIEQRSIGYQFESPGFSFEQNLKESQTNLDLDPSKGRQDFQGIRGEAHRKVGKLVLNGGWKNENAPEFKSGVLQKYRTLRKVHGGFRFPVSDRYKLSFDRELEQKQVQGISNLGYQTTGFDLFSGNSKNLSWNYALKLRAVDDLLLAKETQENTNHSLKVNFKKGRVFNSQIEWVQRQDKDLISGAANHAVASGLDFRYRPGSKLQYSFKLKQEEKRRIVRETSNLDLSQDRKQRRKTYVTPKRPVQTLTTSQQLRLRQNRGLFHRLSYRYRNEEERGADQSLSKNENFSYDLKWKLKKDYRWRYKWQRAERFNLGSGLDKTRYRVNYELARTMGSKMTLTSQVNTLREQNHANYDLKSEKDYSLRLDRALNTRWKTHGRFLKQNRYGVDQGQEWTLGAGVVFTPGLDALRLSFDLEHGLAKDSGTEDKAHTQLYDFRLQKEVFENTYLEGFYKFEKEAPSSKGSGFSASTYQMRVSMDF
jgi:hypothetical protein